MKTSKTQPLELLVATGNRHKVGEIRRILRDYPIVLRDLSSFPPMEAPPEDGSTYLENALQKARYYSEKTGMPCIADDSGLEIDALNGAPGLHSARFCGENTPHAQKIAFVLEKLADVPDAKRSARFRCTAVAWGLTSEPLVAEGSCEGFIARAPQGQGGFGYDPVFFFPPHGCTLSQLDEDAKNAVSHRGNAMRALADLLEKHNLIGSRD